VKGAKWPEVSFAAHALTCTSVAVAAAAAVGAIISFPSFQAYQNRTKPPISGQQLVQNYYITLTINTTPSEPSRPAATELSCTICSFHCDTSTTKPPASRFPLPPICSEQTDRSVQATKWHAS
jgi:hypothetical protein